MYVSEMNKNLKIFACDHRNLSKDNKEWIYPFTRIGTGFNNDCELKDIDGEYSICTNKTNKFLSEYTAIYWIWKNIQSLKIENYIGFVHYRRFFTKTKSNYLNLPLTIVTNDLTSDEIEKFLFKENELFEICKNMNLDGILPSKYPDEVLNKNCNNISQLMFVQSSAMNLGLSYNLCKKIFSILNKHMLQFFDFDICEKVYHDFNTYHFNISILNLKLFDVYNQILEKTIFECLDILKIQFNDLKLHDRAFSYVIERFSSCIFIAFILSGYKFAEIPILMVENKEILN